MISAVSGVLYPFSYTRDNAPDNADEAASRPQSVPELPDTVRISSQALAAHASYERTVQSRKVALDAASPIRG